MRICVNGNIARSFHEQNFKFVLHDECIALYVALLGKTLYLNKKWYIIDNIKITLLVLILLYLKNKSFYEHKVYIENGFKFFNLILRAKFESVIIRDDIVASF